MSRTVTIAPSWKTAAQIYIMALEAGTFEGKRAAERGIMEMAELLDQLKAEQDGDTPCD